MIDHGYRVQQGHNAEANVIPVSIAERSTADGVETDLTYRMADALGMKADRSDPIVRTSRHGHWRRLDVADRFQKIG